MSEDNDHAYIPRGTSSAITKRQQENAAMRRTLLATLVSLGFAGTAFAQAPRYPGAPAAPPPTDAGPPPANTTIVVVQRPQLATIVIEDLPERCKLLAKRTAVPSTTQQLSARIALATCLADARGSALSLIDGQESVLAVERASELAFAILDNVAEVGDAAVNVMALRAKADLYTAMSARMAATVPPPANATPEAAALRDERRQIIEGMTLPWRDRSHELHEAIVELGRKNPQLARNPVAITAIRDSERKLAVPVARR